MYQLTYKNIKLPGKVSPSVYHAIELVKETSEEMLSEITSELLLIEANDRWQCFPDEPDYFLIHQISIADDEQKQTVAEDCARYVLRRDIDFIWSE